MQDQNGNHGDKIQRRKWSERALQAAIEKVENNEKLLVVNAFCGSGKTFTFLDICNELYRRDVINMVLVLSPRVNLCEQYEFSWDKYRTLYVGTKLGLICHRYNQAPLVRRCWFDKNDGVTQQGVATTYASLVSDPRLYEDLCTEYRVAIVADEAQILGSSFEDGRLTDGTRASGVVDRLFKLCKFLIEGTGTPGRSDNEPLLNCKDKYGPPNAFGVRPLQADVTANYLQGVKEGYLRPIETHLSAGKALKEYLDNGQVETLIIKDVDEGMTAILERDSFWQTMVDTAIKELRVIRHREPRYCLLIGACNQRHARKIARYCQETCPDLKSILATSNEASAHEKLRTFKQGGHAILITVGMAYVGYDYPWITAVLYLGSYRHTGWLDQFAFRGGRVIAEIPFEEQCLLIMGPDDRRFREWADMRRLDSEQGLRDRALRKPSSLDGDGPEIQKRLSVITQATVTEISALGMKPTLDLDPRRFEALHKLRQEYNLGPVNLTSLDSLCRAKGIDPFPSPSSPEIIPTPQVKAEAEPSSNLTDQERVGIYRTEINKLTRQIDAMVRDRDPSLDWGWAYQQINSHFGIKISNASSVQLSEVLKWTRDELLPRVRRWRSPTSV